MSTFLAGITTWTCLTQLADPAPSPERETPAVLLGECASATSPFDAGNRAQLFTDRVLVQASQRISFTLHQVRKHPLNPLWKADRPRDGWRPELFGSVIYDEHEKLFKMWYLAEPAGAEGYFDDPNVTCCATTPDRWHESNSSTTVATADHAARRPMPRLRIRIVSPINPSANVIRLAGSGTSLLKGKYWSFGLINVY